MTQIATSVQRGLITGVNYGGVIGGTDSTGIGEATLTDQPYGVLIGNASTLEDIVNLPNAVENHIAESVFEITSDGRLTVNQQTMAFNGLLTSFDPAADQDPTATRLHATNSTFLCTYSNGGTFQGSNNAGARTLGGTWVIRDCNFVRTGISNGRYFFGGFTGSTADFGNLIMDIDGLRIENTRSTGAGSVVFGTAIVDLANSTLNGITLVGNVTAETKGIGSFYQLSPARCANAAQTSGQNGYNFRVLHQESGNGQVSTDVAVDPTNHALLLNEFDLVPYFDATQNQGVIDPVTGAITTPTPYGGRTIVSFQQNRNSAVWNVNPVRLRASDDTFFGEDLPIVFHTGNPPTAANPAEHRQMIGWNINVTDSLGADLTTTTKINFFNSSGASLAWRNIPTNWTGPASATRNTGEATVVGDTNATGYWIEDTVQKYTSATTTSLPRLADDHVYVLRDFRYDLPYSALLAPTLSDSLTVQRKVTAAGGDLNAYLNSRTEGTAPLPTDTITDFADVYPTIRRIWYDEGNPSSTESSFGIEGSGTSIIFDADVNFAASATSINNTSYDILNSTTPTFTGSNNTFVFESRDDANVLTRHNVNWNSTSIASGMTVNSGNHTNLPDLTGVSWTAAGTINISVAGTAGTIQRYLGTVSGTATINLTNTNSASAALSGLGELPAGVTVNLINFTRVFETAFTFNDFSALTPGRIDFYNASNNAHVFGQVLTTSTFTFNSTDHTTLYGLTDAYAVISGRGVRGRIVRFNPQSLVADETSITLQGITEEYPVTAEGSARFGGDFDGVDRAESEWNSILAPNNLLLNLDQASATPASSLRFNLIYQTEIRATRPYHDAVINTQTLPALNAQTNSTLDASRGVANEIALDGRHISITSASRITREEVQYVENLSLTSDADYEQIGLLLTDVIETTESDTFDVPVLPAYTGEAVVQLRLNLAQADGTTSAITFAQETSGDHLWVANAGVLTIQSTVDFASSTTDAARQAAAALALRNAYNAFATWAGTQTEADLDTDNIFVYSHTRAEINAIDSRVIIAEDADLAETRTGETGLNRNGRIVPAQFFRPTNVDGTGTATEVTGFTVNTEQGVAIGTFQRRNLGAVVGETDPGINSTSVAAAVAATLIAEGWAQRGDNPGVVVGDGAADDLQRHGVVENVGETNAGVIIGTTFAR